jgi:hypothetical protein
MSGGVSPGDLARVGRVGVKVQKNFTQRLKFDKLKFDSGRLLYHNRFLKQIRIVRSVTMWPGFGLVSYLSRPGAIGMKLREHPLMMRGGILNWPPIWLWTGGEKNERPRGEVGVLIRVEPSVVEVRSLFLTIQYNDSEYMGSLSFDDAAFCREIYNLLKGLYRHSIAEIGELDISHL